MDVFCTIIKEFLKNEAKNTEYLSLIRGFKKIFKNHKEN